MLLNSPHGLAAMACAQGEIILNDKEMAVQCPVVKATQRDAISRVIGPMKILREKVGRFDFGVTKRIDARFRTDGTSSPVSLLHSFGEYAIARDAVHRFGRLGWLGQCRWRKRRSMKRGRNLLLNCRKLLGVGQNERAKAILCFESLPTTIDLNRGKHRVDNFHKPSVPVGVITLDPPEKIRRDLQPALVSEDAVLAFVKALVVLRCRFLPLRDVILSRVDEVGALPMIRVRSAAYFRKNHDRLGCRKCSFWIDPRTKRTKFLTCSRSNLSREMVTLIENKAVKKGRGESGTHAGTKEVREDSILEVFSNPIL